MKPQKLANPNKYLFFSFLLFCQVQKSQAQVGYQDFFSSTKSNARLAVGPKEAGTQRTNNLQLATTSHDFAVPAKVNLNLFDDVSIQVDFEKDEKTKYKNLIVYRGRSTDPNFKHLKNYHDVVLVYNPNTDKIIIEAATSIGAFEILPTDNSGNYKVVEWEKDENFCKVDQNLLTPSSARQMALTTGCNEQDANGVFVADLFVGYSYQAAAIAGDVEAHALSLVAMVNNGLSNSLVDNIYIRLVGTGINENNPGVVTSVLSSVYDWFEAEIALSAPDYVASIQVPTGAQGEAGGWAGIGGYSSVNGINGAANVFRHEIGHNIGSNHCNPGILPYAAGYNNGNVSTHMCGNGINFYSTPLVSDANGTPIGHAETADNARVWRERAEIVSNRRKHTIKFDENDNGCLLSPIANGSYHLMNLASGDYIGVQGNANGFKLAIKTDSAANTSWTLLQFAPNQFKLKHVQSGRYMDVPGGSRTAGKDIQIWSGANNDNQKFKLVEIGMDTIQIQPLNNLCLQLENGTSTEGSPVEQNTCNDSDDTKWVLQKRDVQGVLTVGVSTTDVSCFGQHTGSAVVNATAGSGTYTYLWEDGNTTSTANNLAPGNYIVTVSDGINSIPFAFEIKQSPSFDVNITTNTSTKNMDGSASILVSGGQSPYTITWSNGDTGFLASNLSAGVQSVNISDQTSCVFQKEFYIACSDLNKPCNDGNSNTVDDRYDENCNCTGIPISCTGGLQNVALGMASTQSSTYQTSVSSKATDGNRDGNFSNGSVTHTDTELQPWWEIDLGAVKEIQSVLLANRTDCCTNRLDSVYLFISETPFISTNLEATIAQAGVWSQALFEKKIPSILTTVNTSGRYVRVQISRTTPTILSLSEVEVYTCGTPNPFAYTSNPITGNEWELKGLIVKNTASIQQIEIEYGESSLTNSITIPTENLPNTDSLWIMHTIDIGTWSSFQFRLKVTTPTGVYFSNVLSKTPQNSHCEAAYTTYLWYKRFRNVAYDDQLITIPGASYIDSTEILLGEFDLGNSYTLTMSTPDAGWTNLFYRIYIDLNNDKHFDDNLELVGSSNPMGQTTAVHIQIPKSNVRVGEFLKLRIFGYESTNAGACSAAVGNTLDLSVKIKAGACEESGNIGVLYLDSDKDGYGDPTNTVLGNCINYPNYVSNDGDFNDSNPFQYNGATEWCDGIDNDGNGLIDDAAVYQETSILLENQVLGTQVYSAQNNISTNLHVQNPNGNKTKLVSAGSIELNPGITIEAGSVFQASIVAGCGN